MTEFKKSEFKRSIVLRARRDTLALILAASGVTLALSHTIHRQPVVAATAVPAPAPAPAAPEPAGEGDWAGNLSDPTMLVATTEESEPLSSAALTVSAAELKLPTVAVRPLVKMRPCIACAPKAKDAKSTQDSKTAQDTKAPKPAPRPVVAAAEAPPHASVVSIVERQDDDLTPPANISPRHAHGRGLMTKLNPFSHLNDVARIGQPLAMAGNAVSAVFHRF